MSELKNTVLDTVKAFDLIRPNDHVLCAVSGGADSVAMLHLLLTLLKLQGCLITAAHINHLLRGEESTRDELFVRELCDTLGVPLEVFHIDVAARANTCKESIELAARKVRYEALRQAAEKHACNKIATAHTASDTLETMLFHLCRGTGSTGLCGIPPKRGEIIRPLIRATRESVLAYLSENGLTYVEDSTNASLSYTRNRLRHKVVPELLLCNPRAAEAAERAAERMREDEAYWNETISELLAENEDLVSYDCNALLSLPAAIQGRLLQRLAQNSMENPNYCLDFTHRCAIMNLARAKSPSVEGHFPNGLVVRRVYDRLVFSPEQKKRSLAPKKLSRGEVICFGAYEIAWFLNQGEKIHKSFQIYPLSCATIDHELCVRTRQVNDWIRLPKQPQKTLKRLMIEKKIPRHLRDSLPVLESNGRVILVHRLGVNESDLGQNKDQTLYIGIRETKC